MRQHVLARDFKAMRFPSSPNAMCHPSSVLPSPSRLSFAFPSFLRLPVFPSPSCLFFAFSSFLRLPVLPSPSSLSFALLSPSRLSFAFKPISMPHCPRCSKKCKTDKRLLQHMNHPASECIQFFDELVRISDVLQRNKLRTHR